MFNCKLLCSSALLVAGTIFMTVGCDGGTPAHTDSAGNPIPATVTNDAQLLVSRCGKPDKDDSTEYDKPRPLIPARLITYKKAHLMFAYIPGADSRLGDPPPYAWKLMGITDTRTKKAIALAQIQGALTKRLPCALGK
jgi:hypothetical protein